MRSSVGVECGGVVRWSSNAKRLVVALGVFALFLGSMDAANARRRHHFHKRYAHAAGTQFRYAPPYAQIVYDVNSGKVLSAVNADAPRHPASITKVMTLFLLFEQLERGKLTLSSELDISAHAASQAPSKLGLRAGSTIEVEDAIKAIVTRSANDIAVAIGENIAGSEDEFADLMTRKARSIGMKNTLFRNASGLPDPEQITTARDLAVLGRVIQDRFPRYYRYFSTRSFAFRGQVIGNHNHLLGRVEGVDGIKTGYTRASGFNLLTSAKLDGHHIITVVLGGRSGRERDNKVVALIDEHMPNSAAGGRRNVQIASADDEEDDDVPAVGVKAPVVATGGAAGSLPKRDGPEVLPAAPAQKAADRPKPAVVAELTKPVAPSQKADAKPVGQPIQLKPNQSGATTIRVGATPPVIASTTPSGPVMRWVRGSAPKGLADADPRVGQPTDPAARRALGLRAEADVDGDLLTTATIAEKTAEPMRPQSVEVRKSVDVQKPVVAETVATAAPIVKETVKPVSVPTRSGWIIQVAATDDEAKAMAILSAAKSKNRALLGGAESFTEKVQKGGATLYRARFGGFAGQEAELACKALKRSGYACFAQHI